MSADELGRGDEHAVPSLPWTGCVRWAPSETPTILSGGHVLNTQSDMEGVQTHPGATNLDAVLPHLQALQVSGPSHVSSGLDQHHQDRSFSFACGSQDLLSFALSCQPPWFASEIPFHLAPVQDSVALGGQQQEQPLNWSFPLQAHDAVNQDGVFFNAALDINPGTGANAPLIISQEVGEAYSGAQPEQLPASVNPWEAIRPKVKELYIDRAMTAEQTLREIRHLHGLDISIHTFNRTIKKWPECRKNEKRSSSHPQPAARRIHQAANNTPKRTRTKKRIGTHQARPKYVPTVAVTGSHHRIPPSLTPALYQVQHSLLHHIDKYVAGFFDSAASKTGVLEAQYLVEWQWRSFLNRCQTVSIVVQKRKLIQLPQLPNEPFAKSKRKQRVADIVRSILRKHVFGEFAGTAESCTPSLLAPFWNLCHGLRGVAVQIEGSNKDDHVYITECIAALRNLLGEPTTDHRASLGQILQHLSQVTPLELHDTIRVSFACTADTLSARLGHQHPLVLGAWASYYRYWEPRAIKKNDTKKSELLEAYGRGFEAIQQQFGPSDDRTIKVLGDYVDTAYYLGNDCHLARTLATDLWQRTRDCDGLSWGPKAQGMAAAASMLAIVCSSYYGHKRRTKGQTKTVMKEMGCNPRRKRGRQKWRQIYTPQPPPPAGEIKEAAACLDQAAQRLQGCEWEWDCAIARAGLCNQLAFFTKEFGEKRSTVLGGGFQSCGSSSWELLIRGEVSLNEFVG